MKSSKIIDSQLVEAFQSGNKVALATLVKRWHKKFCNKAYWLVKDKDVAKDIAQDSWKIIIDKIGTLKNPERFSSWAMRIVYSKSLDWIREESKERWQQQKYYKGQSIADEEPGDNTEIKTQLLKAIKQLSENQQMVLKLFYVEDYSLKDISKILNISVGTVKSRLFHAREQLKRNIKI